MNKVITINLNGNAYQLEEGGFDALRAYLDTAARRLEGNPDKDEIIADIERAIAEKFRSLLGVSKTVVSTPEVAAVIAEMGPVEDDSADEKPSSSGPAPAEPKRTAPPEGSPRRLFKIREGAKLFGVCNGLAAYFDVDVTLVRILFALLVIAWGSGFLLYLALAIILPSATTPDDWAAAHGTAAATAQEFIRRAREGYYEGMRTFGDRHARREWKRRFRHEMRGWKRNFQREMAANAGHWGRSWHEWSHSAPPPGAWFGSPFAGLILFLITLVEIAAIFSLVTTHGFFGITLLSSIPIWVGILLVIIAGHIVKLPFRVMRGWGWGGHDPTGFFWGVIGWIVAAYFLLWLAHGHSAAIRDALDHLSPKLQHATQSIQDWWNRQ